MDGLTAFVLIVMAIIVGVTINSYVDSNNRRKTMEAAAKVDIAKIEYNRMMGIMETPTSDIRELRTKYKAEDMNDYDILNCPSCGGEGSLPNYNNTEQEDCGRCDGSSELRWDNFTEDEKKKYLDK